VRIIQRHPRPKRSKWAVWLLVVCLLLNIFVPAAAARSGISGPGGGARDVGSMSGESSEVLKLPITLLSPPVQDVKLTEIDANNEYPYYGIAASKDGSSIVYVDIERGEGNYNSAIKTVFVLDTASKNKEAIGTFESGSGGYGTVPAISRDGRYVVFWSIEDLLGEVYTYPHLYGYDRDTQQLKAISDPYRTGGDHPAISDDGRWIVYSETSVETGQIMYLYDRDNDRRVRVNKTAEDVPEDGWSSDYVISGDGSTVVFRSTSTNLIGGERNTDDSPMIFVYDTAAAQIVNSYPLLEEGSFNTLAVNHDGALVVYPENEKLILLNLADGSKRNIADNNTSGHYYKLSISDDGHYVTANMKTDDSLAVEWFDVQTDQRQEVGSPEADRHGAVMDGSGQYVVYRSGNALYQHCTYNCEAGEPEEQPIAAVSVTTALDPIGGEISLANGSALQIRATGQAGLDLQAAVRYESTIAAEGEQGPGQEQEEEAAIQLTENTRSPGNYEAYFDIQAGMSRVLSVIVSTAEGPEGVQADWGPMDVAGRLAVDLDIDPELDLEGVNLVISSPTIDIPDGTYGLQWLGTHLEADLPSGTDYTLRVAGRDGAEYASESFVIEHGVVRAMNLAVTPSAELWLNVTYPGGDGAFDPPVQISVQDLETSVTIDTLTLHEPGLVQWGGRHQAGDKFVVTVVASSEDAIAPLPQSVVLQQGRNTLNFIFQKRPEQADQIDVTFSSEVRGFPAIGSDLALTVQTTSGAQLQGIVKVERWNDSDELEVTDSVIKLNEEAQHSGTYTGAFRVEPGIAKIVSIGVKDGEAWLEADYPVDREVAGRILAKLALPEDASDALALLQGGHVDMQFIRGYNVYQSPIYVDGDDELQFDVVNTDRNHQLLIYAPTGQASANRYPVTAPGPGRTVEAALSPQFKVRLSGQVTGEAQQPLRAAVQISDMEGNLLVSGRTDQAGDFQMFVRTYLGESLQVKVVPDEIAMYDSNEFVYKVVTTEDTALAPVALAVKPLQYVSGTVYDRFGEIAPDATVMATLMQDGNSKFYSMKADNNGRYRLQLPAGAVAVKASGSEAQGAMSHIQELLLQDGVDATADLHLLDYAKLYVDLYTKQPGSSWQGPIDIDWRVRSHFRFRMNVSIVSDGSPMSIRSQPGERIEVCVDGAEAGLPEDCQSTVIGEDNEGHIEFRLENTNARIYGQVVDPDGVTMAHGTYHLQRQEADGTWVRQSARQLLESNFNIPLAKDGDYRLVVEGGSKQSAVVAFQVKSGDVLDLGTVRLSPQGRFGGQIGNELYVDAGSVSPYGLTGARIAYANNGQPSAAVSDASLVLELPSELQAIPGTWVVDGHVVAASAQGQAVEVPVGAIAPGESGYARVQLRVANADLKSDAMLTAYIRYRDDSGEREEQLGSLAIRVQPVTLQAPERVVSLSVALSGTAPADSPVTVYDGDAVIGTVIASPTGTWYMNAKLQERGGASTHRLRTETVIDGDRMAGQAAEVRYDPNDPGLEQISMQQTNGREETIRLGEGTAVFPYVIVPGYPFVFKLTFRDPDRISDVRVQMGENTAVAQRSGDIFQTVLPLKSKVGPIWVSYRTKPGPLTVAELRQPGRTEEELRSDWSAPLNQFSFGAFEVHPQQSDGTESLTADYRISDDMQASTKITVQELDSYTPTAADQMREQHSGVPAYDFSMDYSYDERSGKLKVTAVIPSSALSEYQIATLSEQKLASIRMLALPSFKNIKITAETIWTAADAGTKFWDSFKNIWDAFKPQQLDRAKNDLERAMKVCDEEMRPKLVEWAQSAIMDVYFEEGMKTALDIVGVYPAKIPEKASLGLWGGQKYITGMADDTLEDTLQELEYYLAMYDKCMPPKQPDKEPDAVPKYVWDPSGYVYEAVPSQRLDGVQATVLEQDPTTKAWQAWDAEWYLQHNPQLTDAQGRYAWDVPEGKWKAVFEKEGYETAYSDELDVPPPQLDVNIPMVSYLPPEVTAIKAAPGGSQVIVNFSKPMLASTMQEGVVSVHDAEGEEVPGVVAAVDAVAGEGGKLLATAVSFTPDTPLIPGSSYEIAVSGIVSSYAGVPLGDEVKRHIPVAEAGSTPAFEVGRLTGNMAGQAMVLTWSDPSDPDFAGVYVYWKTTGDPAFSVSAPAYAPGQQWAMIENLNPDRNYEFWLRSVDRYGTESTGVKWQWQAKEAPPLPDRDPGGNEGGQDEGNDGDGTENGAPGGNSGSGSSSGSATAPSNEADSESRRLDVGVGATGGELAVFDGQIRLTVPRGLFGSGTQIDVIRHSDIQQMLPEEYRQLSPAFLITPQAGIDGMQLLQPMRIAIDYDVDSLDGADARRSGIYRKDSSAPSGWIYVGGVVDHATNRIEADVEVFGEYAVLLYDHPFADLQGHWSRAELDVLISRHILHGASAARFEPDRMITRAEMVAMLLAFLQESAVSVGDDQSAASFRDVPADAWYADSIRKGAALGLIAGDGDGRFRPNAPLTREEMAALFLRAASSIAGDGSIAGTDMGSFDDGASTSTGEDTTVTDIRRFEDEASISVWARESMRIAIAYGFIQGTTKTRIDPHGPATRAQAAAVLLRVMTHLGRIERQ